MIADDNVDTAEALSIVLTASGYEASVEHCPKGALETARKVMPDVCLLDIGLPQMEGNEVARRLRTRPETSSALLIAVTGYGKSDDHEQAIAAGFDHYLTKPVDISHLLTLLALV